MGSDDFFRLVVGPIGSGKSSGCIMELLRRAREQRPGPDGIRRTRFAAIRNTYRELNDTTRNSFEQWFRPAMEAGVGKWNEQRFTFTLETGDVHAEYLFRALDSAEDVKKLLSLELTGAYLNEAREISPAVIAGLKGRVGRYPSKADGGPSWYGIWADTNPMAVGHSLYKLFKLDRPSGHRVFEQPSGFSPNAENLENLPTGYYETLCQGQDPEWVEEYAKAKYPRHDKGSVYGEQLALLEAVGAFVDFVHPSDGIFLNFDLGVSDATAMWWWRLNGRGGVDFLDYYEATGQSLEHFILEAKRREVEDGWAYARLVLPHDARNRHLTGTTVLERMVEAYPDRVDVLPATSLEQGISATRSLLTKPCRFRTRCAPGLEALKAYRYEWDADTKTFSRKPRHDWASHGADAARYVATYVEQARLVAPKEEKKRPRGFSLEDAWALGDSMRAHRAGRVE